MARAPARRRTVVVALLALTGVGAVAVVSWRLVLRDSAEPASISEALERYRSLAGSGDTPIPVGVYVYDTAGFESIDALGGARHTYPPTSTISVTPAPCGAELRWDVLKGRHNTWLLCGSGDALGLDESSETHRFFGRADTTAWECAGTPWLPRDRSPGSRAALSCRSADTAMTGEVTVVGSEAVTVAGTEVAALRVRVRAVEDGEARGPLSEERWLEPETGLPLRISYRVRTENASPLGDVTFEERYDLRLRSLEPRR